MGQTPRGLFGQLMKHPPPKRDYLAEKGAPLVQPTSCFGSNSIKKTFETLIQVSPCRWFSCLLNQSHCSIQLCHIKGNYRLHIQHIWQLLLMHCIIHLFRQQKSAAAWSHTSRTLVAPFLNAPQVLTGVKALLPYLKAWGAVQGAALCTAREVWAVQGTYPDGCSACCLQWWDTSIALLTLVTVALLLVLLLLRALLY